MLRYSSADMALFAVFPQPSVFFRRSVFDAVGGFDLTYKLLADNDFFSRAVIAGFACSRIDAYLSAQSVHSGNLLVGNPAAVAQARAEGVQYRNARRQEIARTNPSFSYVVSYIKRTLLPLSWRINLLFCVIGSVMGKPAAEFAPWRAIKGDWSAATLIRYLFSRSPRDKHQYFKVAPAELAAFLCFTPPLPAKKLQNEASVP